MLNVAALQVGDRVGIEVRFGRNTYGTVVSHTKSGMVRVAIDGQEGVTVFRVNGVQQGCEKSFAAKLVDAVELSIWEDAKREQRERNQRVADFLNAVQTLLSSKRTGLPTYTEFSHNGLANYGEFTAEEKAQLVTLVSAL